MALTSSLAKHLKIPNLKKIKTKTDPSNLLGSETLGTKCIRTSMCNVLANHDQNLESSFRLLKVYLFVKLESSNCKIYISKSARIDQLKIRLD